MTDAAVDVRRKGMNTDSATLLSALDGRTKSSDREEGSCSKDVKSHLR
jgi:hypothetical protein